MTYIKRPEEDKLYRLLSNSNLCIVSGMAGIGKTSLIDNARKINPSYYSFRFGPFVWDLIQDFLELNTDQLFFIDDVNIKIDFAIKKCEEFLEKYPKSKYVLVTRIKDIDTHHPILRIKPFTAELIDEYLDLFNIKDEELRKMIAEYSNGSPLLLRTIIDLLYKFKEYPPKDVVAQLSDTEIKPYLHIYAPPKQSRTKTSENAREILFQITYFGPVYLGKLKTWNRSQSIDDFINILNENGFISVSEDKAYATLKIMKFSEKEIKQYTDSLVNAFFSDSGDRTLDAGDKRALVELLKNNFSNCRFVSYFYENQFYVENNRNQEQIKQAIIDMTIKQERMKQSIETVDKKLDIVNDKLDTSQETIIEIINGMKLQVNDDDLLQNKLDELISIVKKPDKSKLIIANEILGTLGSVASLASILGVSNLAELVTNLFR